MYPYSRLDLCIVTLMFLKTRSRTKKTIKLRNRKLIMENGKWKMENDETKTKQYGREMETIRG